MQLIRGGEEANTFPLGFPWGSYPWSLIIHEQEGGGLIAMLEYPNLYLLGRAVHPASCIIHDKCV